MPSCHLDTKLSPLLPPLQMASFGASCTMALCSAVLAAMKSFGFQIWILTFLLISISQRPSQLQCRATVASYQSLARSRVSIVSNFVVACVPTLLHHSAAELLRPKLELLLSAMIRQRHHWVLVCETIFPTDSSANWASWTTLSFYHSLCLSLRCWLPFLQMHNRHNDCFFNQQSTPCQRRVNGSGARGAADEHQQNYVGTASSLVE